VLRVEQTGPHTIALDIAVAREGTLKPAAVLGAILGIDAAVLPLVRIHKLATHFHRTAPTEPPLVVAAS
jgi:hypothetical protein